MKSINIIITTGAVLAWAVNGVVDACRTSDECPDVTTVCWRPLGRCISCSWLCAPGRPTQRSCANEPRCSTGSTPAPAITQATALLVRAPESTTLRNDDVDPSQVVVVIATLSVITAAGVVLTCVCLIRQRRHVDRYPVEETGDTVEDTAQLSADRHPPLLDAATAAESADNVL